jgi:glycosyltransferase involved in cell wall biosynthesis
MMHLFINSLAASAGGGLTYIRNVLPIFAAQPNLRVSVAVSSALRNEFPAFPNVDFVVLEDDTKRRFWNEQVMLRKLIRHSDGDVLLSTGNFAVRNSPVPQILLSRNSIYTSSEFYRELLARGEYREWLKTHVRGALARRSVRWADATVAPSEAFAAEFRKWTGGNVKAIHHGFDRESFTRDTAALDPAVEEKLAAADGCFKFLFVSHYNYYRNFDTLFRALPLLRRRLSGRQIKLILTCQLARGRNPGAYHPEKSADLLRDLGVADMVVELGAVPYTKLHQLYRRADVYVTPAYTETFAHPLVEAMASGLPVVASDLAVHREICGDAAIYFPRFSEEGLATAVEQVAAVEGLSKRMACQGLARSREFSWKTHVEKILELAGTLVQAKRAGVGRT